MDDEIVLSGEIDGWPSKPQMVQILEADGLTIIEGLYSIRVKDCEHFVLQQYSGHLGEPIIEANASSLQQMLSDAGRISAALAAAKIRHRFELYNEKYEMVKYLHYLWAQQPNGS